MDTNSMCLYNLITSSSLRSGLKDGSTTLPFWSTARYVGMASCEEGCSNLRELVKADFTAPGNWTYLESGRCESEPARRTLAEGGRIVRVVRGRMFGRALGREAARLGSGNFIVAAL